MAIEFLEDNAKRQEDDRHKYEGDGADTKFMFEIIDSLIADRSDVVEINPKSQAAIKGSDILSILESLGL